MRGPSEGTLMTVAEAGKRLGMKQEAAFKTERRALRKLREGILAIPEIQQLARDMGLTG